jgi:hypothetical protein
LLFVFLLVWLFNCGIPFSLNFFREFFGVRFCPLYVLVVGFLGKFFVFFFSWVFFFCWLMLFFNLNFFLFFLFF